MSTADKLQQLRLERQKSDLSHKLQALQSQLERAENEKSTMAEESGHKIKQALSLLDTARKEIDKLKREKESLTSEVTDLRRQNVELRTSSTPSSVPESRKDVKTTSDDVDGLNTLQENTPNALSWGCAESPNGFSDDHVVVRRQNNEQEVSERPMSMAERMSMFESKKSSGRDFGQSPTTNGVSSQKASWRNAPAQVKLGEEKPDEQESSPVPRRASKVSQNAKDNRHTMPPNAYSPKQISTPPEKPTPKQAAQASSGRDKMRTALGGMMAAIETEKQHKGMWSSRRTTHQGDLDKLLLDNLETFDKTSGSTSTSNSTHRAPHDTKHKSSSAQKSKRNFTYSRTSSKPLYDEIEEEKEDSDPEMKNLARGLKSDLFTGTDKMLDDIDHLYKNSVTKYEKHFIRKSESLCDALNKIDALNIKEENKQFLLENMDNETYCNPLVPQKYSVHPKKLDTNADKHIALRSLMKKRHDFSTRTPTRIFDKSEPTWKPTGLVKLPVKSKYNPSEVVKGETTEKYSSFTRSGLLSPQERVMENIKNLREGDDNMAQVLPSKAKHNKYVPLECEEPPLPRPRGVFTPKPLKKTIKEPPKPMMLPENSKPAPFTYMNSLNPVADLSVIKARKEANKAETNPRTSDDAPLTKGVKRGSVKNLAAMFNSSLKPKQDQSKRSRRKSEGSSRVGGMKHGLIKSKSLVFDNDSGSLGTGISTNDLTCSTKYTDNTDRDVDTSIMDDTADSDLFNDKMLLPHIMLNGQDNNKEEEEDDFQSSESLSRAVSPVLRSRRGSYAYKKRIPKKVESNYSGYYNDKPNFSDTSEDSAQRETQPPVKVFDKELKRTVAVKPELSTIVSQRTPFQSQTDPTITPEEPVTNIMSLTTASNIMPSTAAIVNSTTLTSRPPLIRSRHIGDDVLRQNPAKKPSVPVSSLDDQFDLSKPPKFDSDYDLDCSQSSSSSLKENDCTKNSQDEMKQANIENKLTIISDPSSTKIPFSITEYQKMFAKKQESRDATTTKTRPRFSKQKTITPTSHTNSIAATTRTTINSTLSSRTNTSTPSTRNTSNTSTPSTRNTSTTNTPRGLIKCSTSSLQSRGPTVKFGAQPKSITPKFIGLVNNVAPKNPVKRAQSIAAPGSATSKKAALLHWCQRMTEGHEHVNITNFGKSWNDGMAFCALFHHFVPDQIPYETLDPRNREFNFHLAFTEGEKAGVTALLDVEDMVEMRNPDWMSVMTYISLIYNHFNGIRVGGPRLPPMPGNE
ncbi:uncharacterized protein LOC134812702 [Bolinopsis microptera]|uniref:uncharacterized protein LOC134812702 n=1 Tax=Bolinopsis microptera TaxID=2820187 RepID=UPI00307A62AA